MDDHQSLVRKNHALSRGAGNQDHLHVAEVDGDSANMGTVEV